MRLLDTLIVQNIPVYIFAVASISIEAFALLEYVTAYVGGWLPTYAAKHPTRAKASATLLWKREISHKLFYSFN